MALREFRDSRGTEWTAWDVPPARALTGARSGADRRTTPTPNYRPERRVIRVELLRDEDDLRRAASHDSRS